MKQAIYLLVLSALFFAACNSGEKQTDETQGKNKTENTMTDQSTEK